MEELKITAKKYIKMAQDNRKVVMAGVIVIIVIIASILSSEKNSNIYYKYFLSCLLYTSPSPRDS